MKISKNSKNSLKRLKKGKTLHRLGDFHYRPRLRLIDELISGDQYLAITDATVYDKSGRVRFRSNFLSVNRDHIVLIIPWEEMITKKDTLSLLHKRS